MTISVHGVGSAEATSWPRLPLTFATLMSALRSNNLAAARQAYDDLHSGLQPQVGRLIDPVGAALGAGDLAQAGRMLGQMRGDLASVSRTVAVPPGVAPSLDAGSASAPVTATNTLSAASADPTRAASIVLDWLV
ncbi:hypothetical protein [Sphingomonas sp. PAMC 26605]|uniref:hypothetical protein n=1 Tax=Sphingomonas sp. PAMC 26605 TaxID=1112214 RepID=UPI00026CCA53|nr:hypothetical protein [Sphingomonas sp. PAMC 26605]